MREHPLHATVAADNRGSARVLKKCGFTRMGPLEEEGVALTVFALERRGVPLRVASSR